MELLFVCLDAIAHLFTNSIMNSLLGLIASSVVIYGFKILIR